MTIKNSFILISSCFILSFFTSCQSDKQSAELLEAMEVHKQIMELEKEVNQQFEAKKANLVDSLAIQQLEKLQAQYKTWQSNLVEVPGMEHDHDHHDHDHAHHDHDHHDHGKQDLQVTDAQMLEIQKKLLQELQGIEEALKKA